MTRFCEVGLIQRLGAAIVLPLCTLCFGCTGSLLSERLNVRSWIQSRDTVALHHNQKGLAYLAQGKVAKAELHFQKSINGDPQSAAAHNNLGILFLSRHELYNAAWEFQRAIELAPNQSEPLINLGLVHEQAERLDDATELYAEAVEIDPDNAIAIGNLARALVKQDSDATEVRPLLQRLLFLDTRPDWIEWASELLEIRYRDATYRIEEAHSINATHSLADESAIDQFINPPEVVAPLIFGPTGSQPSRSTESNSAPDTLPMPNRFPINSASSEL